MNREQLVSVIIPCFNRSKTIRRCVSTVLDQTYQRIEVIIVDDGSSDNTAEVIRQIDDPRVKLVVSERNRGAQNARNRGIQEAQGEWIAFQDSDDEWVPGKLQRQVDALRSTGFDLMTVVHSDCFNYDDVSGKKQVRRFPLLEGNDVYPKLLRSNGPMFQGLLTSKTALAGIGYLDENVPSFQEWDTVIRLAKQCRFVHIREPLFAYHLDTENSLSKDRRRDIIGYQYIIDKHENDIRSVCGNDAWERHLYIQLEKCLIFKLWTEAERYLERIETRPSKYRVFQLLCFLHVSPKLLHRFSVLLNGKMRPVLTVIGLTARQ